MSEIILESEVGIDYSNLRDLLASGKWKEADEETYRLTLKVADREKKECLSKDNWLNFPCKDLRTIDQLWIKYSDGRFGFSVQKQIWESKKVGGHPDADYTIECKFGEQVRWRKRGKWLAYSNLTFNITAPVGHLPCFLVWWEFNFWLQMLFLLAAGWFGVGVYGYIIWMIWMWRKLMIAYIGISAFNVFSVLLLLVSVGSIFSIVNIVYMFWNFWYRESGVRLGNLRYILSHKYL